MRLTLTPEICREFQRTGLLKLTDLNFIAQAAVIREAAIKPERTAIARPSVSLAQRLGYESEAAIYSEDEETINFYMNNCAEYSGNDPEVEQRIDEFLEGKRK
jgi:hypothetical protein